MNKKSFKYIFKNTALFLAGVMFISSAALGFWEGTELGLSILFFFISVVSFGLFHDGYIYEKISKHIVNPIIMRGKKTKLFNYIKNKSESWSEKSKNEIKSEKYLFSSINHSVTGSFITLLLTLVFGGIILFKFIKELDVYFYEYVLLAISISLMLPIYLGFEKKNNITKLQYKYTQINNRILKFIGGSSKFILIAFLLYKFFNLPSKTIIIILLIVLILDKRL